MSWTQTASNVYRSLQSASKEHPSLFCMVLREAGATGADDLIEQGIVRVVVLVGLTSFWCMVRDIGATMELGVVQLLKAGLGSFSTQISYWQIASYGYRLSQSASLEQPRSSSIVVRMEVERLTLTETTPVTAEA